MKIHDAPPSLPGSTHRLVLEGELDIASAVRARAGMEHLLGPGLVVELDLGGITFMDSTGVRLLLWAGRTTHAHGGRIVITAMSRPAQRLLALTGAEQVVRSTCSWTLAS